jgi:pSer/pThr/pTyr-binding forkhead associated (FHA) protein
MAVGKEVRGPLWVDGQFTVKVRVPGSDSARVFRVRRAFALIGRIPGADFRIDDPGVDDRHAFLMLDHRGLLGVDLLTRTGTRFAAEDAPWSWLGPGDLFEIAGHRIEVVQLRVDGKTIHPPLSSDNPFAEVHASKLAAVTLEPLDAPGPPWMLGSALGFVGSGDACVIRVENPSVAPIHCALLRTPNFAYVIELLGPRTLLNDKKLEGGSMLLDGDALTIGSARFLVKIDTSAIPRITTLALKSASSTELALNPPETALARILESADPGMDGATHQILDVLRQFQADTATLLEAQFERIAMLNREIASLREEIKNTRGPVEPPAAPLRLDLKPPARATSDESATWLLDRLSTLETESRSTWKDLLGRISSTIHPGTQPEPGRILAPTHPDTPRRD